MIPASENEGVQVVGEIGADSEIATATANATAVADVRVDDERANVPVSVVTERFLRAILDKVPLELIEELHLFSPLRQGTIETGIAVVAARTPFVGAAVDDDIVSAREIVEHHPEVAAAEHADQLKPAIEDADEVMGILEEERAADGVENSVENERDESAGDNESDEFEAVASVTAATAGDQSPYADEAVDDNAADADTDTTVSVAEFDSTEVPMLLTESDLPAEEEAAIQAPPVRHTVYTARYRLVVKGPERGKWEIDVKDEADAPLLTVETVVRGVQRRAGEETATIRYDGSQLARALRIPLAH
ncbi:MAG: hypothetical protein ACO1Q7_03690 [Gemmatimonas sp.]